MTYFQHFRFKVKTLTFSPNALSYVANVIFAVCLCSVRLISPMIFISLFSCSKYFSQILCTTKFLQYNQEFLFTFFVFFVTLADYHRVLLKRRAHLKRRHQLWPHQTKLFMRRGRCSTSKWVKFIENVIKPSKQLKTSIGKR